MSEQEQQLTDDPQQDLRALANIGYINELHRNVFRHYTVAIVNAAVWRDGLAVVHSWKQKQWDQVGSIVEQAVKLEIAMGRKYNYTMVLYPVAGTSKKEKDNGS